MPFLSIIVPVYNAQNYLEQCITSILQQNYSDYELILVNDGSTDNSGYICDKYTNGDNVKVIHKENGGHVSARKAGLNIARGTYIGFVDADDYVTNKMYTIMCQEAISKNADIVICDTYQFDEKKRTNIVQGIRGGYFRKDELLRDVYPYLIYSGKYYEFGVLPALWNKIIRRELLIHNMALVDERIQIGEDAICTYLCMLDARSVSYLKNNYLYCYRSNDKSICHKWNNSKIQSTMILLESFYSALQKYDYPNIMFQFWEYASYMLSNILCEWWEYKIVNSQQQVSQSELQELKESEIVKKFFQEYNKLDIPMHRKFVLKTFLFNKVGYNKLMYGLIYLKRLL